MSDSLVTTPTQQAIYNTWLRHTRLAANQPFRAKKKFELITTETHSLLLRLEQFFISNPNIDVDTFFAAPFHISADSQARFPLSFYVTYKALTMYVAYIRSLRALPPNSEAQRKWTATSFRNIANFCIKNKITLEQYTSNGFVPQCITHYKDGIISPYCLMSLPGVAHTVINMPHDVSQLCFGTERMNDYLLKLKACDGMVTMCKNNVNTINTAISLSRT